MADRPASAAPAEAAPSRIRARVPSIRPALRSIWSALRQAFANDGIRRLGISWMLGIAADGALTVVLLVTVFNRGGVIAAGLLGAVRFIPAIIAGMLAGTMVERFRGDRLLVVLGLIRAAAAGGTALTIATAGTTMADKEITMYSLFVCAAVAAAAGAPVRPTQVTLMPAIARSPGELVAANTVWATGEGLGAFVGPFIAGLLMAINLHAAVAAIAAVAFLITAGISLGLRFEQAADAAGGGRRQAEGGVRLRDGIRLVIRRPLLHWTMLGTFGQVVTRGLMSALVVAASIELLRMGQGGMGLLSAALGFGGLLGAIFAMASRRSERLVRTMLVGLTFWGVPLSIMGLIPVPEVALVAMIVIGVSNATYDVALFTILQRATSNEERASVMSVLEGVIGFGAVAGSLVGPLLLIVLGPRTSLIVGGALLPLLVVMLYTRIGNTEQVTRVKEGVVDLLRHVPEFAELPMTAVERVAEGMVPFSAPAGTALMTQGEPGDRFVVIESGEIEVFVDGRPIHRLGRGAGVGEIALLRRSPRTATVNAITDVTGYSVDAPTFLAAVAGPRAAAVAQRTAEAHLARGAAAAG
jgi:MFS family permease